jgi:hypothetical protein
MRLAEQALCVLAELVDIRCATLDDELACQPVPIAELRSKPACEYQLDEHATAFEWYGAREGRVGEDTDERHECGDCSELAAQRCFHA